MAQHFVLCDLAGLCFDDPLRGIRAIIVSLAGLTDFLNYKAVERSLAGQMLYLYSFLSLLYRVDDT